METERVYEITEKELQKIFNFIISRPIQEAIEVYQIALEVSRRTGSPIPEEVPQKETETKKEDK